MPTALLPNGQTTFVQNPLELSISLTGSQTRADLERALREALTGDPRQLFVRVQGGGGYGAWCFWIQWGHGESCYRTAAILLGENEHTPAAVVSRIKTELSKLDTKDS